MEPVQRRWSLSTQARYAVDWIDRTPGLVAGVLEARRVPAVPHVANLEELRELPGIHAVVTSSEVPATLFTTAGQPHKEPSPYDMAIVNPVVRYMGEPVALIAAQTPNDLRRCLDRAIVEYHGLDGPLHASCPDNVLSRWSTHIGDSIGPIAGDGTTVTVQRQSHLQLEPHASMAMVEPGGRLVIWTTTQVPHHVRRIVARALGCAASQIRVVATDVGGGFGGKQEVIVEPWVAHLARLTGQVVKMQLSRRQEFLLGRTRHSATLRVASLWDGQDLSAMHLEADVNTGPYGGHGSTVAHNMALKTLPLYRCPRYEFSGQVRYAVGPIAGAFRGYGGPQGAMAVETHWDEVARRMGKDPAALRIGSLMKAGDSLDVLDPVKDRRRVFRGEPIQDLIQKCLDAAEWSAPRGLNEGLGLALSMQASGVPQAELAMVQVTLQEDGALWVTTGAVDMGQGAREVLQSIVADAVGMSPRSIRIVPADTDLGAFDYGTYASSTTFVTGSAAHNAAQQVKRQLLDLADILPERSQSQGPWGGYTIEELAEASFYGPHRRPVVGLGVAVPEQSPAPVAVLVARVQVDKDTGQVTVQRLVAGVDVGHPINPIAVQGQIEGALAQGLGYALCEEVHVGDQGHVLTQSLRDYAYLSATEMPPITVILTDTPDPDGPLGAKSAGEVAVAPVAPAIANAIYDAVGVRVRDLPITAQKVWQHMAQSQKVWATRELIEQQD